jgi:hypothetical protein
MTNHEAKPEMTQNSTERLSDERLRELVEILRTKRPLGHSDQNFFDHHACMALEELLLSRSHREAETGVAVAARDLIASRFDTYRAGNNRQVGIQDDSGEKCWIVPFDAMHALEAALSSPQPTAADTGLATPDWKAGYVDGYAAGTRDTLASPQREAEGIEPMDISVAERVLHLLEIYDCNGANLEIAATIASAAIQADRKANGKRETEGREITEEMVTRARDVLMASNAKTRAVVRAALTAALNTKGGE